MDGGRRQNKLHQAWQTPQTPTASKGTFQMFHMHALNNTVLRLDSTWH